MIVALDGNQLLSCGRIAALADSGDFWTHSQGSIATVIACRLRNDVRLLERSSTDRPWEFVSLCLTTA